MKYYSQYHTHDLFELEHTLSCLSKSNRWVRLADNLPWDKIEKEYNKRLRNVHNGAGNKPLLRLFFEMFGQKTIFGLLYNNEDNLVPLFACYKQWGVKKISKP